MQYYNVVTFLLWLAFILVGVIAAGIFMGSGYNKGFWQSLLGFAATIVAAVVSMVLSGFVGYLLSGGVLNALPVPDLEAAGAYSGFIRIILRGVVQNVLAMVLFFLLMFTLTIVLRSLSRRIKLGFLTAGKKPNRLAGMLTGLACAAVYTVLLLLPLYGSLAAYAPAAKQVIGMELAPERAAMQILNAAEDHPLVAISELPPFSAVYDGTARINLSATDSVSAPEILDTVDQTVELLQKVVNTPRDQREAACIELIGYLRENLAGESWFYDLSMEALDQLRNSFPVSDEALSAYFDELDMSQADFEDNMNTLLDFALYALEHDGYTIIAERKYSLLYESEIVQRAGTLANHSSQAVALKNLLMIQLAAELCGNDPEQIQAFCQKYRLERLTDLQQQLQEAQALMKLILTCESCPADFFARHPSLGQEALKEIFETYGFHRIMDLQQDEFYDWDTEETLGFAVWLEEDHALQTRIIENIGDYTDYPISRESLADELWKAAGVYETISGGAQNRLGDCKMPEYAVTMEILGREVFADSWASAAAETWDFFHGYAASVQELPIHSIQDAHYDFVTVLLVLSAIKDGTVPSDEYKDWDLNAILPDDLEVDYEYRTMYSTFADMIGNDALVYMAKQMVQEQGRDPLKLGSGLSRSQRRVLSDYIGRRAKDHEHPLWISVVTPEGWYSLIDIPEAVASGMLGEEALEPLFTSKERSTILKDFFGL